MYNFEEANKIGKEAMDNMLKSYSAMTKGFQTLAAEATDYSKKSYEQGAATLEKLAGARSLEKAIEIQADYAKQSYESFVAQTTKMGEIYSNLARDAYKPFETTTVKATKANA